jgi:hypothetical protein
MKQEGTGPGQTLDLLARGSPTCLPATGGNEQVAPVHLTLPLRSYMVPRFIQSDSHR